MIDKKKLLQELKEDYSSAKEAKASPESKIAKWRKYYKAKPLGNEKKGKSKYVSKDIKKLLKWQLPILLEPFVNTPEIVRCQGLTPEDVEKAKSREALLNYWFCRVFNRYNFLKKAIKLAQVESIVVVQTSWKYRTKKETIIETIENEAGFQEEREVEITKVVENNPDAKIIKFENVFIDPTAEDGEPEFVIIRYETTFSNLRENTSWLNQDAVERLAKKKLSDTEDEQSNSELYQDRMIDEEENGADRDFETSDVSRKKIMVYEYWGKYDINEDGIAENIVCVWAEDEILKLEDNPYPDDEIPFVIFNFDEEPFSIVGESQVEDLYDKSHLITLITRGLIENIASANIGQIGIPDGALNPIEEAKFLNGQNFKFNKQFGDIWQSNYNSLGTTPLQALDMFKRENESLSGITEIALGQQTKVLSATQAQGLDTATNRRLNDIVVNISENLIKPILKKWLSYASEFMSETEMVTLLGNKHVPIQREDISDRVHMEMIVTTLNADDQKSRKLSFLLQTAQQGQDPNIVKMLYTKMLKLDKMYEEAEELKNYSPEPDEYTIQIKNLEIAKLEAEIEQIRTKTLQISKDAELKHYKSIDTKNNADIKDLEFAERINGENHKRDLDKIALQKM